MPVNNPSSASEVGLYVHWPFCLSKCPYCDFNSHVRDTIDEKRWQKALLRQLEDAAKLTEGRPLKSIFFGGGTPSLMHPQTVEKIVNAAHAFWGIEAKTEITLEANPTSVEINRLQGFRSAGINRLSLGIQSLRDQDLTFLGRQHSRRQALKAIKTARTLFPSYSFDLIYARPQQTPQLWAEELKEALDLAGDHLSLYQLTIEPGTAFHTLYRRQAFTLPDEEVAEALYDLTQEKLEAAGLPAYEVSNHAVPGHESQHNLLYWRYKDYIGIGPGAHGRLTLNGRKYATKQVKSPERWLERLDKGEVGPDEFLLLTSEEVIAECLMMGLRLKEGISLWQFEEITGASLMHSVSPKRLNTLREEGLLTVDTSSLKATPAGLKKLNSVLGFLLST